MFVSTKDKNQNYFKNPNSEKIFAILKIIGFVESTDKSENLPIERDLYKPKQLNEE
ncbi:hypothetical protein [Paraclostridium sordellii]|uniref:hypothetical protein n=1 Tax=Paraclostridium sordellii TaxID=1505 RepID=UPI0012D79EBE|nr:hypothetical protein [Paeniclostridium sordellii]